MEKSYKFKVGDIVRLSERGKKEEPLSTRQFEKLKVMLVYRTNGNNIYLLENSNKYYEYKLEHATKLGRALE